MAFTNGSLFGRFEGATATNGALSAFTGSNLNNPNVIPANDIFQIIAPGGSCLLQVTAAYVVNTNVGQLADNNVPVVAQFPMVISQYNSLPANPTAAQICQAAFPINYNNQQYDLIQIAADIAAGALGVPNAAVGGGRVIWRLLYNGATATS